MENSTIIKLELGINAQKFIQQVQIHNHSIEEQIQKGIELAIKDITDGDNFVQIIRENTKSEIYRSVNKAVMSWEIQQQIQKSIAEKVSKKIEEYSETIAEKITKSLK